MLWLQSEINGAADFRLPSGWRGERAPTLPAAQGPHWGMGGARTAGADHRDRTRRPRDSPHWLFSDQG
jgi:hypothetical protein